MLTADESTTDWLRRCDRIRIWALAAFLVLTAFQPVLGMPVRLVVFAIFLGWLAGAVLAERLLDRMTRGMPANALRIGMLAADAVWISALSYQAGATRWVGVAPYMLVVAVAVSALSGWTTLGITAWCSLAYGALLYLETSGLAPVHGWANSAALPTSPAAGTAAWIAGTGTLITFAALGRTWVAFLARREARHRLLFDSSPRPMWVYDVETLRFLAVNDAAVRDYGYSRDEFLAMRLTDIRPAEDHDAVAAFVSSLSDVYAHCGTWRHRRRDGSALDVEITSHPIDVEGRHARLVIATDVTDRVRLETRLRETQRLEALGRLAGGVAHEFNNLLAAVMGHAQLLQSDVPASHPGRESLDEVVRAAQRGAELTRHMLAFGRRQLLRPEVVDVNAVVRDMERLLRPLLAADLRVALELPGAPCWARVDRSQLELVIMNLAMNARDAMPGGGALSIETSLVELGKADRQRHPMAAVVAGRYVRLSVSDTGTGISPDVRERMFEPFFTTKPVGRGTGLGLSTVYGIVKQSEGYVWPYSEVGHGTSMHVYLPCGQAPIPETEGADPHVTAGRTAEATVGRVPTSGGGGATARGGNGTKRRSSVTVLVADDEPALRTAAARILRRAGYRVVEAQHGEEALEVGGAAGCRVDVLVTDVVMPGLGGVALAARLTRHHPGLQVIYMSGYPQSHLIEAGAIPTGHTFIDKPFEAGTLVEAVREAVGGGGGRGRGRRLSYRLL